MFALRDAALARARAFSKAHAVSHRTALFAYDSRASGAKRVCDRTTVTVEKRDALEVALEMRDPLVLILADADVPGGCVFAGAGMQEESLFRRTALFAYLKKYMYPIGSAAALYARNVPVLMDTEANGYAPLPQPRRVSFVACPGLKMPVLASDGRLRAEDAELLRCKIRLIVQVAVANGHTEVVLGALGCGAFGCPAAHVAALFREVLAELDGVLERVCFAVLGAACDAFRKQF